MGLRCFVVLFCCFVVLLYLGRGLGPRQIDKQSCIVCRQFCAKTSNMSKTWVRCRSGTLFLLCFGVFFSLLSSLLAPPTSPPPPQTKRGWTLPRSMNTHTPSKKRQDKKKKSKETSEKHDPQESTSHCFHDEMLMLNGSCGLGGTKSFFLGKTSIGSVGSGSTWGGLYMASRIFTKDCRSERNRGERCMKETNKTKQNHMQPNKIKKTNKPTNEDPPYSYPTPNTHTRTHAHTTQKHTFFEPGVEPTTKMRLWRVSI